MKILQWGCSSPVIIFLLFAFILKIDLTQPEIYFFYILSNSFSSQ